MGWSAPADLGVILAASPVFTVPSNVPVGTVILIAGMDGITGDTYAATDSQGNTYTVLSPVTNPSPAFVAFIGYCQVTTALTGGTDTITVTRNGSTGYTPVLRFFTATGGTATSDGSNSSDSGFSSTWSTGSVTPTVAGDLLFVACGYNTNTTDTPVAGFTDLHLDYSGKGLLTQYQIATGTSAYTGGGTWAANGHGAAQIIALQAGSSSTNVTVNAVSAQLRLRSPAPTVTASTPATVNAPSAQLRLRSASPAVLSTSSALSGPSAQIRLRSSGATVTTGSSASITAPSAQIRLRTSAPTVTTVSNTTVTAPAAQLRFRTSPPTVSTTSGASVQAVSAQIRVRTSPPSLASSSSIKGTAAQIRLRSYGVTVYASAAIPEICNPTTLTLTSNASTLLLTGRDTTMALTGPADTTLTVDSDDASTLTLTIC